MCHNSSKIHNNNNRHTYIHAYEHIIYFYTHAHILYTMKVSRQKSFMVFMVFTWSAKLFHMKVKDGTVQIWI